MTSSFFFSLFTRRTRLSDHPHYSLLYILCFHFSIVHSLFREEHKNNTTMDGTTCTVLSAIISYILLPIRQSIWNIVVNLSTTVEPKQYSTQRPQQHRCFNLTNMTDSTDSLILLTCCAK